MAIHPDGEGRRARASYEATDRAVKFPDKPKGNGGAPIGEPPPEGYEDGSLPF